MSNLDIKRNNDEISITKDNTTIKFGLFLMEQAIYEIESFDINQDLISDLLKLNLAVVHLMNSLELLLKAILQEKGKDVYDSKGDTLNFFDCLKSFSRSFIGSSQKDNKDFLPPSLLSAKNLYGIRNSIVHLGNLSSKYTIVPLFRDALQFFQDSIQIYFPSFEQKTEDILRKTPERIYIMDSSKVYDRFYARYLNYDDEGDFEMAIYALYVAIESLLREHVSDITKETPKYPNLSLLLRIYADNFPEIINNEELEILHYYRIIRNKIVHGAEYEEEDLAELLSKFNEVAQIYENMRTKLSNLEKEE